MAQAADILVGGFERELLRMSGWVDGDPRTAGRLELSARLAILFSATRALVPAPGYFETDVGDFVMRRLKPSQERGQLALHGSGGGPDEYVSFKLDHWKGSGEEQRLYGEAAIGRIDSLDSGAWRSKGEPTDRLLVTNWELAVADGCHPLFGAFRRAGHSESRAARVLAGVPGALEGTVMLVDNIMRHIRQPRLRLEPRERSDLRIHLAQGFFQSYLKDSSTLALVGGDFGVQEVICPVSSPSISGQALVIQLRVLGLEELLLRRVSPETFADVAGSAAWYSLRLKLWDRAQSGSPFSSREQGAVRDHVEAAETGLTLTAPSVQDHLASLDESLEAAGRRGAGTALGAGTSPARRDRFAQSMSLAPSRLRLPSAADRGPIDRDRLSRMLLQVLEASTPDEARRLINIVDDTLYEFEVGRPEVVAELIQERADLADKARVIPQSVRDSLRMIGIGATGSVAGKGILLALKVLFGA